MAGCPSSGRSPSRRACGFATVSKSASTMTSAHSAAGARTRMAPATDCSRYATIPAGVWRPGRGSGNAISDSSLVRRHGLAAAGQSAALIVWQPLSSSRRAHSQWRLSLCHGRAAQRRRGGRRSCGNRRSLLARGNAIKPVSWPASTATATAPSMAKNGSRPAPPRHGGGGRSGLAAQRTGHAAAGALPGCAAALYALHLAASAFDPGYKLFAAAPFLFLLGLRRAVVPHQPSRLRRMPC